MTNFLYALLVCLVTVGVQARTLDVGSGHPYANPQLAAAAALPGDTILIDSGTYTASYYIENLHGTPEAWITIRGVDALAVIFTGSSESMHFTDCTYLIVENMAIVGQTGNGMNFDDGGTIETPSHHIVLQNMYIGEIAASGNNDLLKMSGIDSFLIRNCTFTKGATGGSGIDMVGCHAGVIENNSFDTMGSNAIQAKGGTAFIKIQRNWFSDGGQRAVNLGGSTGLAFFRPIDAPYEAADIVVHANVFVRGTCAVAYVGCTRVDVSNNTISMPERWVMRILQETVDETRFVKCGGNLFRNNLVVFNGLAGTHVNVGPNTAPETFGFESNLWYDSGDPSRSAPTLPTPEARGIRGLNPMLAPPLDYGPLEGSPAIGAGTFVPDLLTDLHGVPYRNPPTIGAIERPIPSAVEHETLSVAGITIAPNPAGNVVHLHGVRGAVKITDFAGREFLSVYASHDARQAATGDTAGDASGLAVDVTQFPAGIYIVRDERSSALLVIRR